MPSIDRVSDLPDDVICHILSFLPTDISVRTSILAKRWRFIWAQIPFLGLGVTCNGFCRDCCGETIEEVNINTFHIGSYDEFKLWIATVFAHNVRNLVISLNPQLMLPRFLFTSNTLVDLSIQDCGFIRVDGTKNLPALKKLRLVNVGYESEASLPHLISGCPVLEELIVERMSLLYCDVCSDTLTRLVVDLDYVISIRFVLPGLRYLRCHVSKSLYITAVNLESLTEADINLSEGKYSYSSSVLSFVSMLHNVKCLTLSTGRMHLSNEEFFLSSNDMFHNLTELKLCADWRFITNFLEIEIANNLQVLAITLKVDDNDVRDWLEPKEVSTCLESHLETVKLVDFEWSSEHEFDMVNYIFRNAKVLKRMEIINTQLHELDSNEKIEVLKRLALLERGSKACRIAFV